jgi:hypothetical protein
VILKTASLALLFPSLSPFLAAAACIPFDQAQKHIGETQCVSGKVLRVESGNGGVHYLDFCEDYGACSFSVVVFASDLKRVGDVDQLAGKTVEIRGEVKEYDGRAEMVLDNAKQLGGEALRLSPLPKSFDVEQRGHFSAGQSRAPHKRSTRKKKGVPTLPAEIPEDAESD